MPPRRESLAALLLHAWASLRSQRGLGLFHGLFHRLVAETLRPMEEDRRCYHLVSGVLVERTVKEVLPTIEHNRDAVRGCRRRMRVRSRKKQR
jgi:hypothetical protein